MLLPVEDITIHIRMDSLYSDPVYTSGGGARSLVCTVCFLSRGGEGQRQAHGNITLYIYSVCVR